MANNWFEFGVVHNVVLPSTSEVRIEEAPSLLSGAQYRAWKGGDIKARGIVAEGGAELIVLSTERFWLSGKPEDLRLFLEALAAAVDEAETRATNFSV